MGSITKAQGNILSETRACVIYGPPAGETGFTVSAEPDIPRRSRVKPTVEVKETAVLSTAPPPLLLSIWAPLFFYLPAATPNPPE